MKRKYSVFAVTWLLACTLLSGQTSLDSLLNLVDRNSPALKVVRQKILEDEAVYRTGLTPNNPEAEMGYLWGNPTGIGNRLDFSVTQYIDFPTIYPQRNSISRLQSEQVKWLYHYNIQELKSQVRKVWVERVYLNRYKRTIDLRQEEAIKLKRDYQEMFESGEVGQLSLNQVKLQMSTLETEQASIEVAIENNMTQIEEFTGIANVKITDESYMDPVPYSLETWEEMYLSAPMVQYHRTSLDLRKAEKKLTRHEKLPGLMAGYYSESIMNERFQGLKVGMTLPLWENHNRSKAAAASLITAELEMSEIMVRQRSWILQKYQSMQSLAHQRKVLELLLSETNNKKLLEISLSSGEISLTEYFYGLDLYYDTIIKLLALERDYHLLAVELGKVMLK